MKHSINCAYFDVCYQFEALLIPRLLRGFITMRGWSFSGNFCIQGYDCNIFLLLPVDGTDFFDWFLNIACTKLCLPDCLLLGFLVAGKKCPAPTALGAEAHFSSQCQWSQFMSSQRQSRRILGLGMVEPNWWLHSGQEAALRAKRPEGKGQGSGIVHQGVLRHTQRCSSGSQVTPHLVKLTIRIVRSGLAVAANGLAPGLFWSVWIARQIFFHPSLLTTFLCISSDFPAASTDWGPVLCHPTHMSLKDAFDRRQAHTSLPGSRVQRFSLWASYFTRIQKCW